VWVSPKHPDRERLLGRQQAQAPEPSGQVLASFPRRGQHGEEQALRVCLDEYRGHPFVQVRLWQRDGRSGDWWPVKGKGISIRIAEAEGVIEALGRALDLAAETRPLERRGAGR
jgi:hypothetical protein